MACALLLVGALATAFACTLASSSAPTPSAKASTDAGASVSTLPAPDGPIELFLRPGPEAGRSYQILSAVDGEQEVTPLGGRGREATASTSRLMELDYRAYRTPAPDEAEIAQVLVLEAARLRLREGPPSHEREVELGNDRLRIREDGKVSLDLRGAQPREQLTPRMLLLRPFVVLRQNQRGDPLAIVIRGAPRARAFLRSLSARELIGWTRVALPEGAVSPGARWKARRFPSHAIGALGLHVELGYELAGFQELDGVECAWVLIRGDLDHRQLRSEKGFVFERAVAHVEGEAWVELATAMAHRIVVEDDVRVAYLRGEAPARVRLRLRYRSRTVLARVVGAEKSKLWADGSARFGER